MADKDIKIRIDTEADTSGAKAVAKSLDDVSKSGDSIRDVLGDDIADKFAALKEETAAWKEEIQEVKEDLPSVADATADIANRQRLQAIADLADRMGDFGSRVEQAGKELREAGNEGGAAFERMGAGMAKVSSQVGTVAAGLAAGGPIGGAAAALAVLVEALFDAWSQGAIRAAKAEAVLAEKVRETEDAATRGLSAAQNRNDQLASDRANIALEKELDTMRNQTKELAAQIAQKRKLQNLENQALDAEDRAGLAEVDADEASGKLSPEDAAKRRSEIESAARDRQAKNAVRDASDNAKVQVSEAATAEAERRRLVKAQQDASKALDDAAKRRAGFQAGLGRGEERLTDLASRDAAGEDVTGELEILRTAIRNLQTEFARSEAQVKIAESDLKKVQSQLDAATEAASKEGREAGDAVEVAEKTKETQDRIRKARGDESAARTRTQTAKEKDPSADKEAGEIASEIGKLADGLSGTGNASGNAKRIIEDAVGRANADGNVLATELPKLAEAVQRAMQSLTSRDAATRAALQEAVRRINNLEGQNRAGGDGR